MPKSSIERSLRYEVRDEAEQSIKDLCIDRANFHEGLRYTGHIQNGVDTADWTEFVSNIDKLVPKENRPNEYYYINDCGWVYEGKLPEIMRVIGDCSARIEDFYILPKRERFDWVVCYCGDGDSMGIYLRE